MKYRVTRFVGKFWRQALLYGFVGVVVFGVLFYQLGTLVPNFSLPEILARSEANSFNKLLANPLFLPHKLAQYLLIRLGHSGPFWMRSVSALWGLAVLVIFFDIIRNWYSRRIAFMGSLLLLTSAWFLHFARLGTPQILFAMSIGLLWVGVHLKSTSAPRIRTILASVAILMICIYIPGLAWLVIPMMVWQRKLIKFELSKIPRWLMVVVIISCLIGIGPLIYGFVNDPWLLRDWLLIPSKLDVGLFWSNLWHLPVWLILRGPEMPVYWLGHVAMFDSFTLVMGFLGAYVLYYYRLLDRVKAVAGIILLALVLAVFSGWLSLVIALPLLFVGVSAGIALFLQQWFTIFPRNPLARFVGVSLVSFVIILACTYNLRSYFIAWPRTPATKQVFNQLS
ncbi:MAG: hypothetical protein ABIQ89_03635 [Candidatus Saccharimonadales bacterium]